jgi:hypothetical protein
MKKFFISLMLLFSVTKMPAETSSFSAPTKAETEAFRLSMDKVKSTVAAYSNILELLANDPKLVEQYKTIARKSEDESSANGRDRMNRIAGELSLTDSRILTAYKKAGITPKEAAMTMETLVGGLMGLAIAEGSGVKKLDLPGGAVKENVEFLQAHKQEVMTVFGQMQSLAQKYPNLKLDEDKSDNSSEKEESPQ